MSCLRSNFFTRRMIASRARSIIKSETYHSGSFSFLCGAAGWQKSSGMASNLDQGIVRGNHTQPKASEQTMQDRQHECEGENDLDEQRQQNGLQLHRRDSRGQSIKLLITAPCYRQCGLIA